MIMARFKSRINIWLMFIAFAMPILLLIVFLLAKFWTGFAAIAILFLLFLILSFPTVYALKGNKLFARCGLFYNKKFCVNEIRSFRRIRSLSSAPALSTKRLRIWFVNGKRLDVSPKNMEKFVSIMTEINPNIKELL